MHADTKRQLAELSARVEKLRQDNEREADKLRSLDNAVDRCVRCALSAILIAPPRLPLPSGAQRRRGQRSSWLCCLVDNSVCTHTGVVLSASS